MQNKSCAWELQQELKQKPTNTKVACCQSVTGGREESKVKQVKVSLITIIMQVFKSLLLRRKES